jgi:hypothetical protein
MVRKRTRYHIWEAKAAAITEVLERNTFLQVYGIVMLTHIQLTRLKRLRWQYGTLMAEWEIKHFTLEDK